MKSLLSIKFTPLLGLAMFALGAPLRAGTMSISSGAPSVNGADIAMLNTTGSYDTGGDEGHIWGDRPVMGQTFTTLSNAGGYSVSSITLQNFNNNITNNAATWTIRLGTVSGTTFTPIATDTSSNSISYIPLDYVTFTFATPVTLAPNTVYGFDWTTNGSGFVTVNNADSNYASGTNFRSGANHVPADNALLFPGDDRVFHVDMIAIPEPSVLALLGVFALRAIRRSKQSRS